MTTPNYDDILSGLDRQAMRLDGVVESPANASAPKTVANARREARLLRQATHIVREHREYVNALQKARDDLTRLIDGAE